MIIFKVEGWKRMYQNEDTREDFCEYLFTEKAVEEFEEHLNNWTKAYGAGSHVEAKVYQIDIPDIPEANYPMVYEFSHGCW